MKKSVFVIIGLTLPLVLLSTPFLSTAASVENKSNASSLNCDAIAGQLHGKPSIKGTECSISFVRQSPQIIGPDGLILNNLSAGKTHAEFMSVTTSSISNNTVPNQAHLSKVFAMGDLALVDQEVFPVLRSLGNSSWNVSAIHTHWLNENPKLIFMHIIGQGDLGALTNQLNNALGKTSIENASTASNQSSSTGTNTSTNTNATAVSVGKLDCNNIAKQLNGKPSPKENECGVSLTRQLPQIMEPNGIVLNNISGGKSDLNFIAIGGNNNSSTASSNQNQSSTTVLVMGDLALLDKEVTPVAKSLSSSNWNVTAIHHHWMNEKPKLMFIHIVAQGDLSTLLDQANSALTQTSIRGTEITSNQTSITVSNSSITGG